MLPDTVPPSDPKQKIIWQEVREKYGYTIPTVYDIQTDRQELATQILVQEWNILVGALRKIREADKELKEKLKELRNE